MKKLEGRPFAARTRDALGRALLFACARSRTTDPTTGLDIVREELLGLIPWRDSAWSNGVRHGPEVWHSLFGDARARREWRHGVLHGTWREWHGNGVKALECAFEDGRPHGKTTAWRRDGTKRFVGEHRAGAKTGEWFHLDRDGALDRKRTGLYADGERLSGIKGFNEWLGSP